MKPYIYICGGCPTPTNAREAGQNFCNTSCNFKDKKEPEMSLDQCLDSYAENYLKEDWQRIRESIRQISEAN